MRSDRSVVSMVGTCFFDLSNASGMSAGALFAFHCWAPAGLLVSSHSYPKRFSKKLLLHLVGVVVQAPSRPLVIVCTPWPLPNVFVQPIPSSSMFAAAGSAPTYLPASAAPCVLPKVWPPA